jgi:hypothetical protein
MDIQVMRGICLGAVFGWGIWVVLGLVVMAIGLINAEEWHGPGL